MFKKILVPLDGSSLADRVLPRVAELAATLQARVTLLHVCYSPVAELAGEGSPGTLAAAETQERKFCEQFLARTCRDLEARGLQADWACLDGVPAREIIAYAQEHGYDLIALGTHGRGEIAWNLGGVADKVAAHATVPVLLFRTLKARPPVLKAKLKEFATEMERYFAWGLPG
jgi:nucleotide-binding universal stress UspA family protein